MSSVNTDTIGEDRPGLRYRLLMMPLPLVLHLVYLGLALALCYSFVGYFTRMAIEMDQMFPADSRVGVFFFFLAPLFWMGVILSFRQVRFVGFISQTLLALVIAIISHVPFFYYAVDFGQCWRGLVFGVPASLFLLPLSLVSYAGVCICLMGRDVVVKKHVPATSES